MSLLYHFYTGSSPGDSIYMYVLVTMIFVGLLIGFTKPVFAILMIAVKDSHTLLVKTTPLVGKTKQIN